MIPAANNKLHVAPHLEEGMRHIFEYPNSGDMRSVRPSIRAQEGAARMFFAEEQKKKGIIVSEVCECIWDELYQLTNCIPLPSQRSIRPNVSEIAKELVAIYNNLLEHFYDCHRTTGIDARRDTIFGACLFCASLLLDTLTRAQLESSAAKLALRTAVETYINMHFLRLKDDPTIWMQYRSFGSGQAKLSFLNI
jgi:hypothetical protein